MKIEEQDWKFRIRYGGIRTILSLILFTVVMNSPEAQLRPVIKNLVFEGAGIRGIAYCGSIMELESRQLMSAVEKVGGTSAGAIVALALSLGYTGGEIEKLITGTNFRKFNDGRYFFVGGIHRTNKRFGWYRGRRFEKWLAKFIADKTGDAEITFEQLVAKGFRELYITGTCLNKQRLIVFSKVTYPHMKVKDAVRISMSIPLYFEAVFLDSLGNVVYRPKEVQGLDVMVDGGLLGNYPIGIFDSLPSKDPNTLGFRMDTDEQIGNDRERKGLAPMPINSLKDYMAAFYNIVLENINRQLLTDEDWRRTVSISDGNIRPRIRRLSENEIRILIENGRQAVKTYLN
ncbi:MAG: patatin-like phospholipase family protein [Chitinophagaceae bacterium]|nr:patatin-like phospholipase family protein [Chitinophagaceae bacterium]